MRAAELQPKLKLQLDEITKLEKSAEQVKTELEQLRSQRDTSVSHQYNYRSNEGPAH
jgi:cell shape-determining protein MreC